MSTIYKRVTRAWYINYDLIQLYDKNFRTLHELNVCYVYLTYLEIVIKNFAKKFPVQSSSGNLLRGSTYF